MARNIKKTIILLVTIMFIFANCDFCIAKDISIKTKCGKYYKNHKIIAEVLEDAGYDDIHIAGVIGNWAVESTLNPSQLEIGGGHQGHGLMQVSDTSGTYWTLMLRDWHKIKNSPKKQTKWLMKNFAPERWKEYKKQKFSTPEDAAAYFCRRLEVGPVYSEKLIYANQWYKERVKKKEQQQKEKEALKREQELLRLKTIDEVIANQKTIKNIEYLDVYNNEVIIENFNCEYDSDDLFDLFLAKKNGIYVLIEDNKE